LQNEIRLKIKRGSLNLKYIFPYNYIFKLRKSGIKMRKKGARRIIKPVLYELEKMPDGNNLERLALKQGLKPEEYSKGVNARRKVSSKRSTGAFYTALFDELYRDRILANASMPLFRESSTGEYYEVGFRPDSQVAGDLRNTYIEVKAISVWMGKPFFGYSQIANSIAALLEDNGAEVMTAIFRYGKGHESPFLGRCKRKEEGRHICDNRCLVKTLSHRTQDLLIVPHNILLFLLAISKSERMDQTRSNSSRNSEDYRRPYGTWITMLHEHYKNCSAFQKIFDFKTAREKSQGGNSVRTTLLRLSGEEDFNLADFHLEDLTATQRIFGIDEDGNDIPEERIYCRSARGIPIYRIKPFTITEYKNPHGRKWVETMREKLPALIELLDIKKQYDRVVERRAIQKAETTEIPVVVDEIPI
jgi:hypothetical protein